MNRRRLLQLGAGTGFAVACAAGTVAWLKPSAAAPALLLDAAARSCFSALANVMLDGSLPTDAATRRVAIERHLERVQQIVAGLPPHARTDLAQLLTLLDTRIGRWALMGAGRTWHDLPPAQLVATLNGMRRSTLALRQQAYLALRELTMAAYFAEPATWRRLGYDGPRAI
jgi:hypothetical protein